MTNEFWFIGRCSVKGCNSIVRVTVPANHKQITRNVNYWPGANNPPIYQTFTKSEPAWHPHYLGLHCAAHRRPLRWNQINGVLNEAHVCDARCTSAKGHNCECSCGGANHGKAHAI